MNKTQWQCLLVSHENNSQFVLSLGVFFEISVFILRFFYLSMVTQKVTPSFCLFPFIDQTNTNAHFMLQALIPTNTCKLESQRISKSAKIGPKDIREMFKRFDERDIWELASWIPICDLLRNGHSTVIKKMAWRRRKTPAQPSF